MVIPHSKETPEAIKRILNKHNMIVYIRVNNTIRSALMKVKDKFPNDEQQDVVYEISCHNCNAFRVGETSRQLNIRLKEHKQYLKHIPKSSVDLKNRSVIALHTLETNPTSKGPKCFRKG